MKHISTLFLILCFCLTGIQAKDIKLPDSYAFTRGVEAYSQEQYQDALDWFNREISDHPENGYAFVYVATMRYGNQEYGKALTAINEAIKKLPKKDNDWRSMSFASRAEIYAAMEDTVKAINDLNQAIKLDPSNPKFYKSRAQIYYEQNNFLLSDADYNKMIELDQGDTLGYMGLGRNAKTQGKWDDAIDRFNYVIKLAPDYSGAYAFRAEAYMAQEKWAEAADDIIRALDLDSDDKALYLMTSFPEEGNAILIPKLKIQMAKDPTNAYWPYCIAQVYYALQDYNSAIDYFEKANSIDPDIYFLKKLSACYQQLGDLNQALEYIERALNISPQNYEAIDIKAGILSQLQRLEEAVETRTQYLEANPESSLSYFDNGEDKMNLGLFNQAIEDFNTAAVIFPFLEEVEFFLIKRADAYNLTGQKEKALADYRKVIELEKDSVAATRMWTPFAYTGLGDNQKAEQTMLEIIANDTTDSAGNYYNLACIYARSNEKDKALEALQQAFDKGYADINHALVDYDLNNMRGYPPFIDFTVKNIKGKAPGKVINIPVVDADKVQDETGIFETVEIPFTKDGGVTKVACTINGLPLHFVFDTGAADVTISMVEANFMLKNDYIKPQDIIGTARYVDANGDINEGTVINLRNVNFGGLELDNVRASVVRNQKAPLLLGQSVLGRLGKIEIDNPAQKLKITHKVK
ncbi:MAG: tetratricopeptide repeat protein [Muribaculaceae bacterium]|nr:tetratricopeptide repeat protein [Muribaculaceae bacterium]